MTSSITNCEGSSAEGSSSSSSTIQSMSATTIEAPPVPAAIGIGTPSDGASAATAKAVPKVEEKAKPVDKRE